MWDNSEPTGIDAIQQREEDGRRYNLNGQRVGRDYKGIVTQVQDRSANIG
jgi:hypothetical protein